MAEIHEEENTSNENEKNIEVNVERKEKSKTPTLDANGRDLTKLAELGLLEKVVGREDEINRIILILNRKRKKNPVLLGKAGCGKTAIVESLAIMIHEGKIKSLRGKRLIELNLGSIMSDTKMRGSFEKKMKTIIDELESNPECLVFIDEIHQIIGMGGGCSNSMDTANMLKPALARGTIQVIGATTLTSYKQTFEEDGAMDRRFNKILVEPTSIEDTKKILHKSKDYYQNYHGVTISDDNCDLIVELSERFINGHHRVSPDKEFDCMDEIFSMVKVKNFSIPPIIIELEEKKNKVTESKDKSVRQQDYEAASRFREEEKKLDMQLQTEKENWQSNEKIEKIPVTQEDIYTTISKMTRMPIKKLSEDEGVQLLKMPEEIKQRVIGQDYAVDKTCEAIFRNKSGLNYMGKKPVGSFVYCGSTGIGKSETAKALALYLYGDSSRLIIIDGSEYSLAHESAKLLGSPAGFVNSNEGGALINRLNTMGSGVLLIDEACKIHPTIINIFLQALDEAKITDARGVPASLKHFVIIFTTNSGAIELQDHKSLGFGAKEQQGDIEEIIKKALKKNFKPEFLNRIDEIITFNKLTTENISEITELNIGRLAKSVEKLGFKLSVSKTLKDKIAELGYDKELGVRPLNRTIIKYIQTPISKNLLLKKFKPGDTIFVDWDKKKEEVKVSIKK